MKFRLKFISVLMLNVILYQILFPSVAMALTSGDTQPDVWAYQPVDATDNVSLTSGKLNYTIPITSIPEYPMAIGYNSGCLMDQEGGMFGYGFNGFSGAIARNVMGLPDDLQDGTRKYNYSNEKKWDASLSGTLSFASIPIGGPIGEYCKAGPNVSLQIGYCNYTGVYGAVGLGFGLSAKIPGMTVSPAGGVGAFIKNDSRESGIVYGVGASLGISYNLQGKGADGGTKSNHPFYESLAGAFATNKKGGSGAYIATQVGKSIFPTRNESNLTSVSPLASVVPNASGWGVSLTIPISNSFSLTAAYSKFNFGNEAMDKKGYGFMYLNKDNYDRRNRDHLADIGIEGEDSRNEQTRNSPTYLQRDFFTLNAMGMIGTMQLFHKEYGVVSRNYQRSQFRDFSIIGIGTQRQEVYPWVKVGQARQKKGVDIIALLKKKNNPEDKDFDNVIFEENELRSMTTDADKFGDSEFKMRGDLAGQFDISSSSSTDHEVNKYDLIHISGTGGSPKYGFIKEEQDMPLYYPVLASNDQYKSKNIEKGTNIIKRRVSEILGAVSGSDLLTQDYNGTTQSDYFNMRQSFYMHERYTGTSAKSAPAVLGNYSNIEKMSGLKHMKDMAQLSPTLYSSIGSIEVQNPNGLRYIFNLPAYVKANKSTQLSGIGKNPPKISGSGVDRKYHSGDDEKDRNKVVVSDEYYYPYAWMLTAIVGDDYIDFDNIPGPSDGDLGYWVKFKYALAASNYKFRNPYSGLDFISGAIHRVDDDTYFCTYGEKEIYYLTAVESPSYIVQYRLEKRFDAIDAAEAVNGEMYNPQYNGPTNPNADYTGNTSQFLVTQIDLYKKHFTGDNSKVIDPPMLKPIKSTKFYYDYSICKGVPNNYVTSNPNSIPTAWVQYHIDYNPDGSAPLTHIQSGKATLRKVQHIAYDEDGNPMPLPSYQFTYWGDGVNEGKYNPNYDRQRVDQWGNYSVNAKCNNPTGSDSYYYTHYTELNKHVAEDNSKVYNLKSIALPSGGSLNIDYQPQTYGYVQDKKPYVMRKVKDFHVTNSGIYPNETTAEIEVDISDLAYTDISGTEHNDGLFGGTNPVFAAGSSEWNNVYGEIAFYQNNQTSTSRNEDDIYVASETASLITTQPSGNVPVYDPVAKSWKQKIVLMGHASGSNYYTPFYYDCKRYLYTESYKMIAMKDGSSDPNDYLNMENTDAWDAAKKIAANVRNIFTSDAGFYTDFNVAYGDPASSIFNDMSYIRTPAGNAKYTGSAVKSITMKDGFQYATNAAGTAPEENENEYGSNYFFDENGDGTGRSMGVTALEPGGGKSAVVDLLNLRGAGFAPPPQIVSSKTTVENLYHQDERKTNPSTNSVVSRNKGKTVYEFYTAKDNDYQFRNHFKSTDWGGAPAEPKGNFFLFGLWTFFIIKFKVLGVKVMLEIPLWLPVTVNWKRSDAYHLKSYAYTDNTDIYGRPKNIIQYDASGTEMGRQNYEYYGMDESVPVYGKGTEYGSTAVDAQGKTINKPGMMDQVWSEAYYTKESKIKLIPWILFLNAKTKREFSFTNMKYTYVPPIIKKVSTTLDGLVTNTVNTGFDRVTGTPIEVRSNDSYGNIKIVRSVPAYWKYAGMGPSAENPDWTNRISENTGTYVYLDDVSHSYDAAVNTNKILGAGVVEWAANDINDNKWSIADYYRPIRIPYSTLSDVYSYGYNVVSGGQIESSYMPQQGRLLDKYIKRNAQLFRPYKGHTYDVDLNANGTFKTFGAFNYSAIVQNAAWKTISTNQIFSANGVVLQTKDALNKYASQLIGYNMSNTIGASTNASLAASVYDGAENYFRTTYNNTVPPVFTSAPYMSANSRVQLVDAKIVGKCERQYTSALLNQNAFLSGLGRVVHIKLPTIVNPNIPFAKIDVMFAGGQLRALFISRDAYGRYIVTSNLGEDFNGFYTYVPNNSPTTPCGAHDVDLYFTWRDFGSFVLDNAYTQAGYTVCANVENIVWCDDFKPVRYQLPVNDCISETHTGDFAFRLDGSTTTSAIGTKVEISTRTLPNADDIRRRYKALVWVYNVCKKDYTDLVYEIRNNSGGLITQNYVSVTTPYAVAGNWSLLRYDFDLSTMDLATQRAYVYMRNRSKLGIVIYDDLRVLPYDAEMTNWVFDHATNRVTSALDHDNFASYSKYDERGRVKESAVEIQDQGKTVIQKFLYNNQKQQ